MFQLDDTFLNDVGLSTLPDDQKRAFLQHVYEELELRVGTRLSDGMSDAQLQEFEAIIDRRMDIVDGWLARFVPNYQTDSAFVRLQQATRLPATDPSLKSEFAATKWLEYNRPNYRDVVAQVLEELKREISANKDMILGGSSAQAA
ncbi:MAG TPA: DUF5663 domain-containing protein [Candidatus Saccharimonadales bacterium]|nr:DUF5663 domain-containing protein [Candidatus Saccharimonadales bacterium]